MDAVTLYEQALADGVRFELVDGEVIIEAKPEQRHWLQRLKPHKADIVALLGGNGHAEPAPESHELAETGTPAPWVPFPVNVLPEPVREFTAAAADALGCDASYVALPMLATLAGCVGTSRQIRLKQSWAEPCVLWCVSIGRSGTLKSPAWEAAIRPLQTVQTRAFRDHAAAMDEYTVALALFDADYAQWKKTGRKKGEPAPERPAEPVARRYVASDTTIEALATLLADNPRGLLLARDELSGWLSSFDAYRNGRGGDVAHWLSIHRAGPVTIDRKTGQRRTMYIPRAAVSVGGTIQPAVLRASLLGDDGRGLFWVNGMAARLLLAMPPEQPKRWREADVTRDVSGRIEWLVGDLLSLRPQSDGFGGVEPVDVPLQADARQEFIAFAEAHAAEQTALGDNLAACWSKLEGYAARFALLFQLIRQAAGEASGDAVELPDMRGGIELSRWFGQEAARIYRDLGDITDGPRGRQARERAQLVEWIRERGGTVTARELQQGPRRFRGSIDAAEAALYDLVKAGYGKWRDLPTTPQGGRPARAFSLGNGYGTPLKPEENDGSVAVASVAAEKVDERHSGNGHDQWGEV